MNCIHAGSLLLGANLRDDDDDQLDKKIEEVEDFYEAEQNKNKLLTILFLHKLFLTVIKLRAFSLHRHK